MPKTIALLTDFGVKDHFAGVMKGVINTITPQAKIIDITHEVERQAVDKAAFLLLSSFTFFPRKTVFVAVVDPEVGSTRVPLAIKTKNYYFIGPDNGVLSLAAEADGIKAVVRLTNNKCFLKYISATFQGRDVFAPAAAYLSKGVPFFSLGEKKKEFKKLVIPKPLIAKNKINGQVIYVDRFGNMVTNIKKDHLKSFLSAGLESSFKQKKISRLLSSYAEAQESMPFFIEGGFGYLEIALKNKSAQDYFKVKTNDKTKVIIKLKK